MKEIPLLKNVQRGRLIESLPLYNVILQGIVSKIPDSQGGSTD